MPPDAAKWLRELKSNPTELRLVELAIYALLNGCLPENARTILTQLEGNGT